MPKKMTHGEFVSRVESERGKDYEVLGEYKNFRTKVLIRHAPCNTEYEVTPANLLHYKKKCKKCTNKQNGRNKSLGQSGFASKVKDIYGDEYKVLGKYINARTKILIKHVCGSERYYLPYNFLNGRGCPVCSTRKRRTPQDFVKEVYDLTGDEYTPLGDFVNVESKLLMRHNECGNEWMVAPSKFINNRRCPNCIFSQGETVISEALDSMYCNYLKEYKFDDCRHERELRFDFAVIENDKVILLIEYDGIQHFKVTGGWGTEEQLRITKLRDEIKNEYCKKNDIPLIRIPYWEKENAKGIISQELMPKMSRQCSFAI